MPTSEFMNRLIRGGDREESAPPSVPAGRAHMNGAIRSAGGLPAEQPTGEDGTERPAPGSQPGRLRASRERPSSGIEPESMGDMLRGEATAFRRGWRFRD